MNIIAIDPGPKTSGLVVIDREGTVLRHANVAENEAVLAQIAAISDDDVVVIERPVSMGQGKPLLVATAEWAGRFYQRAVDLERSVRWHTFNEVRCHHAHAGAKEAAVRQALAVRYTSQPFAKGHSHAWAALAVGLLFLDQTAPIRQVAELVARKWRAPQGAPSRTEITIEQIGRT